MPHALQNFFIGGAALVGLGAVNIAAFTIPISAPVIAASNITSFPDTQNYWAKPFIHSLAERNIVSGYPDGTYRPEQAVNRDEFAAIIRDAFNQKRERKIASGSVYKDVPKSYWAAPAIESAYEMGFMQGYAGGYFRPRQPVTKVEAISALARNLKLKNSAQLPPVGIVPNSTNQVPSPQVNGAQPVRPLATRIRAFMFPMAITTLMQPLLTRPASANAVSTPSEMTPQTATQKPASALVSEYYKDANKIPQYAIGDVAEATRSGIVVNHPNLKVLNPNQPATRGEIAALVYQALVSQGRVAPIADPRATQYVVGQR